MLLSHHILVQACFDLVRRRNILDVQDGLDILFFLFLLYLLLVGNTALPLQVSDVYEANVRHAALQHVVHILLKLWIGEHPLIIKLAYRIHGLVHTIITDTDAVGQFKHLSRLALRPAADKAHILIVGVFVRAAVLAGIPASFFGLLQFFQFLQFLILLVFICHFPISILSDLLFRRAITQRPARYAADCAFRGCHTINPENVLPGLL